MKFNDPKKVMIFDLDLKTHIKSLEATVYKYKSPIGTVLILLAVLLSISSVLLSFATYLAAGLFGIIPLLQLHYSPDVYTMIYAGYFVLAVSTLIAFWGKYRIDHPSLIRVRSW